MNDTPNPAELRAAEAAQKADTNGQFETMTDWMVHRTNVEARAIRSSLHLDEVREVLRDAVTVFHLMGQGDEKSHWTMKQRTAEQALKFLSE